jgi:hypothetical protein
VRIEVNLSLEKIVLFAAGMARAGLTSTPLTS